MKRLLQSCRAKFGRSPRYGRWAVCMGLMYLALSAGMARAAEQPGGGNSLDLELLQDLPRGKPARTEANPAPSAPAPVSGDTAARPDLPMTAGEDVGPAGQAAPESQIARLMRAVEMRLARQDVSPATLEDQQRIVAALTRWIDEAEAESAQAESSPPSQQNQSAPRSDANRTSAGPDPGEMQIGNPSLEREPLDSQRTQDLLKEVWGQLPQRVRGQIQTPLNERFLPAYEQVIEDYYRRLAEEDRGP